MTSTDLRDRIIEALHGAFPAEWHDSTDPADCRTCAERAATVLAVVLPEWERQVRAQIAAEIEAAEAARGDGSAWDHGMATAADIARGDQP